MMGKEGVQAPDDDLRPEIIIPSLRSKSRGSMLGY